MKIKADLEVLRDLKMQIMKLMAKSPELAKSEPELAEAIEPGEGGEDEMEDEIEEESSIKKMVREEMGSKPKAPKRPGTAMLVVGMGSPKMGGKRKG